MKNIYRVALAGGAFLLFSTTIFGGRVYAANRIDNIESNFTIQSHRDGNSRKISVDHLFFKFDSEFKIKQQVKDGDFFEIETHVLPQIGKGDIYAGSDKKTIIGDIKCNETRRSARSAQSIFAGDSADFHNIDPTNGNLRKCIIAFNKNAENRSDISVAFKNSNINVSNAIVNRNYDISAWVKVNGIEKYSQDLTVIGFSKRSNDISHNFYHYRTVLDTDNGTFYTGPGFSAGKNLTGHFLEIEISEDSLIIFSNDQQKNIPRGGSNFIYDDNSFVNPKGVIKHSSSAGSWQPKFESVEDRKYVMKVESQTGESLASGVSVDVIRLKLTPEAVEYYKEYGKLPNVKYTLRIRDEHGNIIKENKSDAVVNIVGTKTSFESFVQESAKPNNSKDSDTDSPKSDEHFDEPAQSNNYLNTPNTGFAKSSNKEIIVVIGVALILAFGTYYAYKK